MRVTRTKDAGVETCLVLGNDVQVGLLLGELGARGGLEVASRSNLAIGAVARPLEGEKLATRGVLPRLRAREVSDAQLSGLETACLVCAHLGSTFHGLGTFPVRATFRLVRGLTCPNGVTELRRGVLDVSIAVLAQGLERILRIPRHIVE